MKCVCCGHITPLEVWEHVNNGHTMTSVQQEVARKSATLLLCPRCGNAISAYELKLPKKRTTRPRPANKTR